MSVRVGMWRRVGAMVAAALLGAAVVQGMLPAAAATTGGAWFPVNLPAPYGVYDIAFGNGTYVATDINNPELSDSYWTSPDGVTWTARRFPVAGKFSSVGFANGKFVLFGWRPGGTANSFAAVSADGMAWSTAPLNVRAGIWDVAYGNGTYVAVGGQPLEGSASLGYLLTSTDGLTWTQQSAGVTAPWLSVAFGNGTFVVGVAYTGGAQPTITSANGVNWTLQPGERPLAEIAFGDGVFVGVGPVGAVSTSSDGATWVDHTLDDGRRWTSVAYGSGRFVATTFTGADPVITSPDGATWTSEVAPAGSWSKVAAGDTTFVAVSYEPPGRVLVSGSSVFTPIGGAGNPSRTTTVAPGITLPAQSMLKTANIRSVSTLSAATQGATSAVRVPLGRDVRIAIGGLPPKTPVTVTLPSRSGNVPIAMLTTTTSGVARLPVVQMTTRGTRLASIALPDGTARWARLRIT